MTRHRQPRRRDAHTVRADRQKGADPGVAGEPLSACPFFTAWAYGRSSYPNPASLTAEGDRAGTSVAGLGDVNGDGVPDVLVSTPGWNNSAGAVSVIYGHRGRNQGYIALYANGQGLATSVGHTIWDGNIPIPQSHPYGNGNPWDFPFGPAPQILERTEEAVSGYSYGVNGGWLDCSNYMTEPGDQAGSAVPRYRHLPRPRSRRSGRPESRRRLGAGRRGRPAPRRARTAGQRARPMPLAPPVTITTLSLMSMVFLHW